MLLVKFIPYPIGNLIYNILQEAVRGLGVLIEVGFKLTLGD